jgi:hypothetical protein
MATRVAPAAELAQLRSEAAAPAPEPSQDFGSATKVATVQEIQRALRAGGDPEPAAAAALDPAATKVASVQEIRRALAAAEGAPAPTPAPAEPEWYVLVAGKQQGPMTLSGVRTLLDRHEIDKRTYVWRDGMPEWQRLGAVAELKDQGQRAGDASWRVMAPVADEPSDAGFDNVATAAMDADAIAKQLARARLAPIDERAASPTIDAATRATEVSTPADLSDPDLIAALSGDPTGERMTRPMSERDSEEILQAPELYPAGIDGDLGIESLHQPGEEALDLGRPRRGPASGRPSLEPAFPEATEEPVESAVDPLAAAFNEETGESRQDPFGPPGEQAQYLDAPPGESTRVFMATAGIYKRRRTHQIAAGIGILASVIIVGVVSLDIIGVVQIPLMGMVYEQTGLIDPNRERGIERVERQLSRDDLDTTRRAELEAMRTKLLGIGGGAATPRGKGPNPRGTGPRTDGGTDEGVVDTRAMKDGDRKLAQDVFGDGRKSERRIVLADPGSTATPNLPDGLTQAAIAQVFSDNSQSLTLCFTESTRKGEKLSGKMEIEVTIVPDGSVSSVDIAGSEFKKTVMASCTIRRVKNWKFPRFNGEPVTVVLPYILQPVF